MRVELRRFVERVWLSDVTSPSAVEHVLPTGAMHVVLRFADGPLRLFRPDGRAHDVGYALVGGARAAFYARAVGGRSCSVGAMLRPGVARALFGATAAELAERHTPLEDLWGRREVEELRDAIQTRPEHARVIFETTLAKRLRDVGPLSPAVAAAIAAPARPIAEHVRASGYSHRAFTELFRREVGLSPKRFARVRRLQRAIALLSTRLDLADVALEAGYADQPHLCRDFAAMAGMSPAAYRRLAPAAPNHVDFVQDART